MRALPLLLLLAGCDALLAPRADYDPGVPGSVDQAMCRLGFTAVPLRTLLTGHHLVEARLNGRPARFIVDTGANVSVIDTPAAIRLGMAPVKVRVGAVVGIGGNQRVGMGRIENLTLGGVNIRRDTLITTDLSQLTGSLGRISGGIDGLIGQDVMKEHRAVIDVPRALLYLMAERGRPELPPPEACDRA